MLKVNASEQDIELMERLLKEVHLEHRFSRRVQAVPNLHYQIPVEISRNLAMHPASASP